MGPDPSTAQFAGRVRGAEEFPTDMLERPSHGMFIVPLGAIRAGEVPLADGRREQHPTRVEEKALRTLAKAGCGPEELRLIVSQVGQGFPTVDGRAKRLSEIAEFAASIGGPAARDYFRAIEETRAVAELTDDRVLAFARSVDAHTAEWYFWAIWGTKAVTELTNERVLKAVEFFRSIDSPATVEYFLAIRETKAAAELTNETILTFAESIGSDAAVEYFGAFWETKAVAELTSERVLSFARSIGGEAAKEYFLALRETKAVAELTDGNVLTLASSLGSRVAADYFRAIRETKAAAALTNENVLLFAETIGRGPAKEYFRVIESTKAVAALTTEGLLRMSGVIRAIGSDAALDYFLAVAAAKVVPLPTGTAESGSVPAPATTVPVLTLLDIPTYDRYRPLGLLSVSVLFWVGLWQFASITTVASQGLAELSVAVTAWVALLCAGYLLLGVLAERSGEEFLKRRRRLLNEHGIRWHDCFATEQRCELCWSAGHTHEDRQYDYGRFCRCPAC